MTTMAPFQPRPTAFPGPLRRALIAVSIVLWVGLSGCSGDGGSETAPAAVDPEGFSFMGLGADSRYDKGVRRRLEADLGSDAIATRTTIDLSLHYIGFLKAFFPSLDALNRRLNDAAGARVEHDTVRLMYRYPPRPFRYVELVFSGDSGKPLYFKITTYKEGSAIIDTFAEKYGEPERDEWQAKGGVSLSWRNDNDVLVASQTVDRFGDPQYQIMIVFVDNLERLLESEARQLREEAEQRRRSGQSAF
jgi:hypothetical protein